MEGKEGACCQKKTNELVETIETINSSRHSSYNACVYYNAKAVI